MSQLKTIQENFFDFIESREDELRNPESAKTYITEKSEFNIFKDALLDGAFSTASEQRKMNDLLNREYAAITENFADVGGSTAGSMPVAYAVSHFPILIDLYHQPIMQKLLTTYTMSNPNDSIPRNKYFHSIRKTDGIEEIETDKLYKEFPDARDLVRPGLHEVNVKAGETPFNFFDIEDENKNKIVKDKEKFRISKRYFRVSKVYIEEGHVAAAGDMYVDTVIPAGVEAPYTVISGGAAKATQGVVVEADVTIAADDEIYRQTIVEPHVRADAREQVKADIRHTPLNATSPVTLFVHGNMDFGTGAFVWYAVSSDEAVLPKASVKSVDVRVQFMGKGYDYGVVEVKLAQSNIDLYADVADNFKITFEREFLQDWKDVYNQDIYLQFKDIIQRQMLLNRDIELAEILEGAVYATKQWGHYQEVDLTGNTGSFVANHSPRQYVDMFKNLVVPILYVMESMFSTIVRYPKFAVCSPKVGAILKSFQDFTFKLAANAQIGGFGSVDRLGRFNDLEVIISQSLKSDHIFLVDKSEVKNEATLIFGDYIPLYMIEEVTDSMTKLHIRSRNVMALVRPEGIGAVKLIGLENIFYNG